MGGWDGTEAPSIPKESHQHLQWGEGLIERGRGRRFPMPSIDGADRGGGGDPIKARAPASSVS